VAENNMTSIMMQSNNNQIDTDNKLRIATTSTTTAIMVQG
jgi:hypothetical protein